jgi:hypothetical protein
MSFADLVSGRSTQVVHGGVFALAIPDPNPNGQTPPIRIPDPAPLASPYLLHARA